MVHGGGSPLQGGILMESTVITSVTSRPGRALRRAAIGVTGAAALAAGLLAAGPTALAGANGEGVYQQTNLVSDIPGVARVTDPNLVNPWGMSEFPNGPLWVSDNNADAATLYTGDQPGGPLTAAPLVLKIAGGAPTGQVLNPPRALAVTP